MGKSKKSNTNGYVAMFIEFGNKRQNEWFDNLPDNLPLVYQGTIEDEDNNEIGDVWEIRMPRLIGAAYAKKARSLQTKDCPIARVD